MFERPFLWLHQHARYRDSRMKTDTVTQVRVTFSDLNINNCFFYQCNFKQHLRNALKML